MSWSGSAVFTQFVITNLLRDPDNTVPSTYGNLQADAAKAALFDNTVTPNKDAVIASTGYNTGVWASGEVTGGANWSAGGRTLSTTTLSSGSGFAMYDAADTAGGGTVTITNARGCLVYDDATTANPADQGVCYNDFGSDQSVTSGTFTIVWHANGIFRITV